jgi:hypothetical protein
MPTAPRSTFLGRLLRGRQRWHGPDFADMGTAFGLDQWLGEVAGAKSVAPTPAPAPRAGARAGRWRIWFGRRSRV